jgi:catechol 2,3-dioxygenase-like lactoylglutathione lyase family enzyme
MQINSFDHVHIYAADPERTLGFYASHFSAERVGSIPNSSGGRNHFLLIGGQLLVVSAFPRGLAPATPPEAGDGALKTGYGVAHLGFNVKDVDATVAQLSRAGVPILAPTVTSGLIKYTYVSGPDGVVLELTEYILPAKLRPLAPVLAGYNRLVHGIRRRLVQAALPR